MEVSQSLTLNEAALQQLPDDKKPHFIFEWLRFLDKTDIKNCQQKLVAQLVNLLRENLGPPARRVLARCLATLFSVGDTFLLFDTVNKCNDIIKVKDDSPSYLPTRLAAICCLGSMYEKLGRMMGRSYEETVTNLVRGVRAAAAHVLRSMLPLQKLTATDVDAIAAACLRAAHPSDYQLRCAIAELLGALFAATQAGDATSITTKNKLGMPPALNLLMGAFLRGGTSFLKGEIIKSGSGVNREVRVCVTHAYVNFVQNMGGVWLERNMTTFLNHVLDLVANPKAASSHVDAVYSRKCINYILRNTLGKMLGEKAQASACREIIQIHLLVCALTEAGELSLQLGTSVHNLVADNTLKMIDTIFTVTLEGRAGALSALHSLLVHCPALEC
ncbi:unnamed protein product, partial [Leptidea sinapis]